MLFKDNEKRRSTIWRTILSVSSVLIIIVALFFIIRIFTVNPLEGTWVNEDSGEVIEIRDGEVTMSSSDDESGAESSTVQCSVDTKTKVFSVEGVSAYSEGTLSGSYDYNIEQDTLTLTEREYGDQLVFVRKQ